MAFMMHKMIAVISSSNLLMNSGLLNISKPLVPEISLVRWFDFLCISLMMKVSPNLKCHNMILQSPVTGFLSQVKALFFVLKLEELNSIFAMSSWELRKRFCVHARAFQSQSSRCFLEEEEQRKKRFLCCSWMLVKRQVTGGLILPVLLVDSDEKPVQQLNTV